VKVIFLMLYNGINISGYIQKDMNDITSPVYWFQNIVDSSVANIIMAVLGFIIFLAFFIVTLALSKKSENDFHEAVWKRFF